MGHRTGYNQYYSGKPMKRNNKKGQVIPMIYFFIFAVILVITTAVLATFGTNFSTQMYEFGEEMIIDSQLVLNDIENVEVRERLNNTFNSAIDATEDNITVSSALFKYSWIILLVIMFFLFFVLSRVLVQSENFGSGGVF